MTSSARSITAVLIAVVLAATVTLNTTRVFAEPPPQATLAGAPAINLTMDREKRQVKRSFTYVTVRGPDAIPYVVVIDAKPYVVVMEWKRLQGVSELQKKADQLKTELRSIERQIKELQKWEVKVFKPRSYMKSYIKNRIGK